MGTRINVSLSQSSFNEAAKKVREYRNRIVDRNELFVRRLCEVGIPIIDANMVTEGDSDTEHNTYIKLNSFGTYSQAELIVESKSILFLEFGAGVHYNGAAGSSPHPKGQEFGYTIGSYGKGLGKNDSWTYTAETGEWVRSYGTKASMPVYKASVEIRSKIQQIAKEVFSS